MQRLILSIALCAGSYALVACGYTVGLDEFGAGIRSVAIEVVDNRTFRQGLEVPLTRAIHVSLARHTDLRPASPERADAILRVAIAEIRGQGLVRGGQSALREGSLDFIVDAALIARNGAELRRCELRDRAEFRVPLGEDEASAGAEAVSDLARKIVLALESDF